MHGDDADAVDADRLETFPVFASLTAEQRGEVAAAMSEVTVEPGEALATEGEYAYQLFAIEDGQAEVRKGGELIRTLGPGDVFGEIGLHATGTRTATVVATTPMRLAADLHARVSPDRARDARPGARPAGPDGRARGPHRVLSPPRPA